MAASSTSAASTYAENPEIHAEAVAAQRSSFSRYLTLCCLFLIFTVDIVSRYIVVFLYTVKVKDDWTIEKKEKVSMKKELHMTTAQFGILTGPAFMILAAFSNIFAGFALDKWNRKWVGTLAVLLLASGTFSVSYCQNFTQVLICRFSQAIGQAFAPPLAYSMIADLFLKSNRAAANGFYASAIYIGYGLSSLSLLLITREGWRFTTFIAGIVGFAACLCSFLFIREPVRETVQYYITHAKKQTSKNEDLTTALLPKVNEDGINSNTLDSSNDSNDNVVVDTVEGTQSLISSSSTTSVVAVEKTLSYPRKVLNSLQLSSMQLLLVGSALRMAGGVVMGSFLPQYFNDTFPDKKDEFAIINSAVCATAGTLSSLVGGRIADKFFSRSSKKLRTKLQGEFGDENATEEVLESYSSITNIAPFALFSAISCIISVPFFVGVFFIPNLYAAMAMLFAAYLLSECWYAPTFCIIHNSPNIPQQLKGVAVSLLIGGTSILSCGAPVLVGYVHDQLHETQWEMVFGVLVPNALGGLVFLCLYFSLQKQSYQLGKKAMEEKKMV